MKENFKPDILGLTLICLLVTGVIQTANAVGTASGTAVDNFAVVDYQVGGVDQTQIFSDTASFVVDNIIDLVVATVDGSAVIVVPGDTMQILTYTLTNNGNTTQDYSFTVPGGSGTFYRVTDNFDAVNVTNYVDANDNGVYDPLVDVNSYADELMADSTVSVFVVADIPVTQVDGDGAIYDLVAQTAQGGTPGSQGADILNDDGGNTSPGGTPNDIPDDPLTIQLVFADGAGSVDGANDGRFSSSDVYVVGAAVLTVDKSSSVTSDPFNGGSNPKAIPGATILYTIDVANSGSADAGTVILTDQIPANTTYTGGSISTLNSNGGATITVEYSADGAIWSSSETSPVAYVRVTNSVIDANDGINDGTAQVTFEVTIN
jgi:uncharacterized repeat protein (TIGR01451 family)